MADSITLGDKRPARPPDHRGEHGDLAVSPNEIAVGVLIGRVGQFFDFFVYGIASVLVFPGLFFPYLPAYEGLFYSFVIFSFGFVARIPGAVLFRLLHDRHGRGTKLFAALLMLGTSTVCIAFLPGYDEMGAVAIVLLAVLRVTQGMAVGGAWDGLPSLLALTAPPDRKGWYAMISQIGAPVGFLVAVGLFAYLSSSIAPRDFINWGWRFAFFTAFAINVVTLFARLRMSVTPEYEEMFLARELIPAPFRDLWAIRKDMLLGAMAPLASYALFHLVTIFPLTWYVLNGDRFPLDDIFFLQILGAFLCIITMLVSGKVADRIGRVRTLWWGSIIIVLFCLPAPVLGNTEFGARAFIPIGFAVLGFALAQAAGATNRWFDQHHRYSGALITNELSWLVGAAFAPLIALVLAHALGNAGVALYLFAAAVIALLSLRKNINRTRS